MIQFKLLLLFLFFAWSISLSAQDSIDVFIKNQMKEQRIVGLSLGIVKNGKVVKTTGYGTANIELSVPVTEQTVFKIASLSKQFIAVGILKLIQDGRLTLNTSVKSIIKNTPDTWRPITIRHLLNHTSGLPVDPPEFDGMKSMPDSVYIARSFKEKLSFKAGTKFEYSNFGYYVLADIIRITSRQSFAEYMRSNIFVPANMKATTVTSVDSIIANRASGYIEDSTHRIRNAPNYIAVRPSGAFLSNINDLLAWELIMEKQTDTAMTDAFKTTFTMDNEPIYYRNGWMINKVGAYHLAHHGGSLPGFKSVYFRYLEDKTAIIILTNSDQADAYAIAFGISTMILPVQN